MGNEGFDCTVESQLNQLQSNIATTVLSATRKKRCLPGTPDPDAEVIALSPKSLLATNRFICEVCSKGFQREQNLQLHRRGHNLPWKLKQKSTKEVKKKVYVCPEPACVHHDPSRALGDFTGIKKHFCRKHGDKKWKCEKCSKKYAVQSDWKAHSKICGTREYRCDCGTLFSRRDSFVTHRAFCDALAQERERLHNRGLQLYNHQQPQFDHLIQSSNPSLRSIQSLLPSTLLKQNFHEGPQSFNEFLGFSSIPGQFSSNNGSNPQSSFMYNSGFLSNKNQCNDSLLPSASGLSLLDHCNSAVLNDHLSESLFSLYTSHMQNNIVLPQIPAATLLHKSAQMGATGTGSNNHLLLGGFTDGGGSTNGNNMGLNWQDQRSSSSSSSFPNSNSPSFHMNNLDQMKANFSSGQDQSQQLQDIMSSIERGSLPSSLGSVFQAGGSENGSDLGDLSATNCLNIENQSLELYNLGAFESRHHSVVSSMNLGGTDGLTRDFLGVGARFLGGYGQVDEGYLH